MLEKNTCEIITIICIHFQMKIANGIFQIISVAAILFLKMWDLFYIWNSHENEFICNSTASYDAMSLMML